MSLIKSLVKIHIRAGAIALLSFFLLAKSGKAVILTVDDNGSYTTRADDLGNPLPAGTNTIANLGFNMVPVTDSNLPDGAIVPSLTSVDGIITFTPATNPLHGTVPNTFATWSHGYTGPVYLFTNSIATIVLPSGVRAFDFFAQPHSFGSTALIATATDGSQAVLSQNVNGSAGAKYFGYYLSPDDKTSIASVSFVPSANPGIPSTPAQKSNTQIAFENSGGTTPADVLDTVFAVGELRVSAASIPEPSHELGTLAFSVLSAGYLLKRQLKKGQASSTL